MTALRILAADPHALYRSRKGEIDAAVLRALDSGRYILGPEVTAFERELARYLGAAQAAGVGNGTDALELALRACGVGPGDVVVTVSHTAVATVAAIELVGARPLLVDVDPETYTMDVAQLAAALDAGPVKAVIPVHIYGQSAAIAEIVALANAHGVRVIEDCAQSTGASLCGVKTGIAGDVAAFSFYPTKNLAALGDGGAVVTRDAALDAQVRSLREYGWRARYVSDRPGLNSRLDELQAAILRVNLRHLDADNARRRAVAKLYDAELAATRLALPTVRAGAEHVYHQYVVRASGGARDALRASLAARGIGTLIHYPVPVHLQPAYAGRVALAPGGLSVTERVAGEIVSLPMHQALGDDDARDVCAALVAFDRETAP